MSVGLLADLLIQLVDRFLQARIQGQQGSPSSAGMWSERQRLERVLAGLAPQRVAQPQTVIEGHGLQGVLYSGSHAYPLLTVPQQAPQISLLGGRHPDGWEAVFRQQLQQQLRIP